MARASERSTENLPEGGKRASGQSWVLALEHRAALVTGDLPQPEPLTDQFFRDANVVFEIEKEETGWRVRSPATFGPSGTLALPKLSDSFLRSHGHRSDAWPPRADCRRRRCTPRAPAEDVWRQHPVRRSLGCRVWVMGCQASRWEAKV